MYVGETPWLGLPGKQLGKDDGVFPLFLWNGCLRLLWRPNQCLDGVGRGAETERGEDLGSVHREFLIPQRK